MSVWYAIPSKRPCEETMACFNAWTERGYRLAIQRDTIDSPSAGMWTARWPDAYFTFTAYTGYANAVNDLVARILRMDPNTQWIVTGGDDVFPDPNKTADEIAEECSLHFWKLHGEEYIGGYVGETYGVMQPTGDGHGIETIAGSPWMGREFCQRINGGRGPLWPEYTHAFVDNELQEVAKKLGIFWQRPDLTHRHDNWMWTTGVKPAFLEEAYSPGHWDRYLPLFSSRRAAGFPGHEPSGWA